MTTQAPSVIIDPAICTGCGECVIECPMQVIEFGGDNKAVPVHLEKCIQCCHCVAVCPVNALSAPAYDQGNFASIQPEPPVAFHELLSLLRRRRSVRRYKEQTVPREIIAQLIEAARYAPTGSNLQGCKYIIIDGFAPVRSVASVMVDYYLGLAKMMSTPWGRATIRLTAGGSAYNSLKRYIPVIHEMAERFRKGGDPVFHSAPLLIGIHTGPGSFTAHDDCIIAMYHMIMAAETLGLGSCLNGFLTNSAQRSAAVRRAMRVPEGHNLYAAATFGRPDVKFYRQVDRFAPEIEWVER